MDNDVTAPESIAFTNSTTKRREWWGWLGSMVWLFFMMYGHDPFIFPQFHYGEGSWYPFFFMVVFAVAIIAFGLRFGKDPNGLSRVASCTAPVALIITALFALLPAPLGSVLYAVSPVFMAPALTRRVFGILHTAGKGKRLTYYMSAITVCVTCYSVWLIARPPKEIAFLIPAFLAIPALLGIRRAVTLPRESPATAALKFSKRLSLALVGALILLFWLDIMHAIIHTHVVAIGINTSDALITLLGLILPVACFLLYAIINDKGHERAVLISGMMLFIAGTLIGLMPGSMRPPWSIPLTIMNNLSSSYSEFFILTIPVYFLVSAKQPVFIASLGVVANLVLSALSYSISIWLPEIFWSLGAPVLFSAGLSAIGFVTLVFFLFERRREKTLATALYVLLYGGGSVAQAQANKTAEVDATEKQSVSAAGFTREETEIALLLLEGKTRSEITRALRLKAADVDSLTNAIRHKISGIGGLDPVITAVAKKFTLTRREVDMLRFLRKGMTNPQIAAELYISEATVKNHVFNLMRKLPVNSRQDIPAWLEMVDIQIE